MRVQHSLSVMNHYFRVTAGLDTGTPLKQPRGSGALRKHRSPWVSRVLGESEQDEKLTENCSGCGATKILWIFSLLMLLSWRV